ncbi:MAG: TetR/AcrR family transcriptional regulator, partial [Myxococcales bacterium]|nr:TetR/AcrR family transcriptional regulator [Myxococcales bacterium]
MPRPRFATLAPDRRAAILAAAAAEFAAHGIDGASYNRIIARAAVSKGAMYYYFDDKQDLLRAVLDDASERAAAAIG